MNWDALSAVAEILAALGVIVTLAYLAYQLKHNTQALKLNAEFAAAEEHLRGTVDLSGTTVPSIVFKGYEDPSQLTREESAQFLFWLNGSMRMYQHQHLMFMEGNLSSASWTATQQLLKGSVQTKGFKEYWLLRKNTFSELFQNLIDQMETTGVVSFANLVDSIRSRREDV